MKVVSWNTVDDRALRPTNIKARLYLEYVRSQKYTVLTDRGMPIMKVEQTLLDLIAVLL